MVDVDEKNKKRNGVIRQWYVLVNLLCLAGGGYFLMLPILGMDAPKHSTIIAAHFFVSLAANCAAIWSLSNNAERFERNQSLQYFCFIKIAPAAIGGVNLGLAWVSISNFDHTILWTLSFAIPGFSLLLHFFREKPKSEPEGFSKEIGLKEGETDGESQNILHSLFLMTAIPVLYFGALTVIGAIALTYFVFIRGVIFQGVITPHSLLTEVFSKFLEGMTPTLIGIAVAMFIIYGAISAIVALVSFITARRGEKFYASFSKEQEGLAGEVEKAVYSFIDSYEDTNIAYSVGAIFFVITMIALMVGVFFLEPLSQNLVEGLRTKEFDLYIYHDDFGLGALLAVFTSIFITTSIFYAIFSLSKDGAISSYLDPQNRPYQGNHHFLIRRDISRGIITSEKPFDVKTYLYRRYIGQSLYIYGTTIFLTCVTLSFVTLDRMSYSIYTENVIEHSSYWSLGSDIYEYSSVDRIELTCKIYDSEDGLSLIYAIQLKDGPGLRVIDLDTPREFQTKLNEQLPIWENIHQKLKMHATPVTEKYFNPIGKKDAISQFEPSVCTRELNQLVNAETAKRILEIMMPAR